MIITIIDSATFGKKVGNSWDVESKWKGIIMATKLKTVNSFHKKAIEKQAKEICPLNKWHDKFAIPWWS